MYLGNTQDREWDPIPVYAYQLRAKLESGLTLVGQDDEGNLEWCGTHEHWSKSARLERNFEDLQVWVQEKKN